MSLNCMNVAVSLMKRNVNCDSKSWCNVESKHKGISIQCSSVFFGTRLFKVVKQKEKLHRELPK